jgi:hypothetical protein
MRVRRVTHDGVATGEREIVPADAEVHCTAAKSLTRKDIDQSI